MGAVGRAGAREWQLPWSANRSGNFVARGVYWVASQSVVRPHILVESAGAKRARGRHGTNARFTMADGAMERCLYLQGCASRHGGSAWLGLSAFVCNSVAESNDCAARFKRKIFRCTFPAARARKDFVAQVSLPVGKPGVSLGESHQQAGCPPGPTDKMSVLRAQLTCLHIS